MLKNLKTAPNNVEGQEVIKVEDILVFDVILGSLQKTIRDMGIAAREVGETLSIPLTKMVSWIKLLIQSRILLYETKRARRALSGLE